MSLEVFQKFQLSVFISFEEHRLQSSLIYHVRMESTDNTKIGMKGQNSYQRNEDCHKNSIREFF